MRLDEIIRNPVPSKNPLRLPGSMPTQQHLYHGTELHHLAGIVHSNTLYRGVHWGKPDEPHGVRCTRDFNVGKEFAFDREIPGGLLVLDWPELARRYQSIPYADVDAEGQPWGQDEQEEVVLTASIRPILQYVDVIFMQSETLELLRKGEFLKKGWLQSFADWSGGPLHVHRRRIASLMACEKLKPIAS